MLRYLVSALTLLSLLATIGGLEVTIELDPPEIGADDTELEMECKFKVDSSVTTVDWQYKADADTAVQIVNWGADNAAADNGPKPDYVGRLNVSEVEATSQELIVTGVSWCNDLGYYDCYVEVDDTNVRGVSAETSLTARRGPGKMMLDGNDFEENTEVTTPSGTVTCMGSWLNANVEASLDNGVDAPVVVAGTATSTCTHNAEASIDYTFNAPGELIFNCTVTYDGEAAESTIYGVYYGVPVPTEPPPVEDSAAFLSMHVLLVLASILASITGKYA